MVKQMQGKYKVASPVLRPLWEEAKKMARRIESFEMRHTLRGGNKEADRLANEVMDKGMGKSGSGANAASGVRGVSAVSKPVPAVTARPYPTPPAKPDRQVLDGYVKNGVVHLLEGELPDGIFVKIIRE
jgi:probable phosphoglycerate mutase